MIKNIKKVPLILLSLMSVFLSACSVETSSSMSEYLPEISSSDTHTPLTSKDDNLPETNDNTVLYFKFNEGSGSFIEDETKYHHDGTVINLNNNSWVEGKYGNALSFKTNANQYVYVEDSPLLTPSEITIEFIVKFESASRYIPLQRLIFKDWAYNVFIDNSGTPVINFNLYSESNTAWETAKVRLNGEVYDGKFHHLAFTYNAVSGLVRGYFDYFCEDNVYLSPGLLMPQDRNYPLYVGAGYWADNVQQASTSIVDTLRISSTDLYATDFLASNVYSDNYLETINNETSIGEMRYDIDLLNNNEGNIIDQNNNVLGGMTVGNATYSVDGLYVKQYEQEAEFSVDKEQFTSGNFAIEAIVTLDENSKPKITDRADGTILYKADDFMICTFVYDAGGTYGNIVTFRMNLDKNAGLISVENQMTVNYNLYDGLPHHLAINYDALTMTMNGYIDYKKVVSKTILGATDPFFTLSDSPILLGRSISNWNGDGWYKHIRLHDGNVTSKDMFGYSEEIGEEILESGKEVVNVNFNEDVNSNVSLDYSLNNNSCYFLGESKIKKENGISYLNITKDEKDAAYINSSASLKSSSVSVDIKMRLNLDNLTYGLHRLVFKDFQYDMCLDIKSNGIAITSKINTKKDGWITRTIGDASVLLDGEFHSLKMTYNSSIGVIRLFVDDTLVAKNIWGGEINSADTNIYVGAGYWSNGLHQGLSCDIDELKIYNYAI